MMMNFNYCNNEEYNLQNEAYCRMGMVIPNRSTSVNMCNSKENSARMRGKEISNFISPEVSQNNYFTKEKKKVGKWTKDEDEILKELVINYAGKSWKKIADHIRGRTEIQCLHRWTKILQPGLVKGSWTIEEDRKLVSWIKKFGAIKWSQCSQFIKGRSDKQCRERWFNCLNPKVKKGDWEVEEDYKIFFLYRQHGSKWAEIANYFKGRSENSIKNRFYSTLRRYVTEHKKRQKEIEKTRNLNYFQQLKETISSDILKPLGVAKDDLMKYFEISFYEAKEKLLMEKKWSEEDFKLFESQIEKTVESENYEMNDDLSIINNNSLMFNNDRIDTKSQGSFCNSSTILKLNLKNLDFDLCDGSNSSNQSDTLKLDANDSQISKESAQNFYRSMDIFSLEKNISEMCDDNNLFFPDPQLGHFDNYIDNMMEGIFKNINDNSNFENLVKFNNLDAAMNYEDISRNNIDDVNEIFGGETIKQYGCAPMDLLKITNYVSLEIAASNKQQGSNNEIDCISSKKMCQDSSTKIYENRIDSNVNKKSLVFDSLYDQLNDLERLIRSAKRELIKYGKSNVGK